MGAVDAIFPIGPLLAACVLTGRRNTFRVREALHMGRMGRKRHLEVEARYWKLLAAGVGTVEACRRVGITTKTGYRWRAEAGGVTPLRLAEARGRTL